jgi:hypothetical protein
MLTLVLASLAFLATPPATGPTLAVEDTMHTAVPEVLVNAPRVTLDEILDRVARGEARRDSLLDDQQFTFTLRAMGHIRGKKGPQVLMENVRRVYRKRPDKVRSVLLREYEYKEDPKKRDAVRAEFSSNMSEEIVNFAFRPEARRDYRYHIESRAVVGDHVVYRIAFEPRSRLDFENPSGLVWVDTNDFVIVREELNFDRSPAPLILKGIDRVVIERMRVGEYWVLKRVLLRMSMTIPMPRLGRSFDLSLLYSDYALNQGIDDSMFEGVPVAEQP